MVHCNNWPTNRLLTVCLAATQVWQLLARAGGWPADLSGLRAVGTDGHHRVHLPVHLRALQLPDRMVVPSDPLHRRLVLDGKNTREPNRCVNENDISHLSIFDIIWSVRIESTVASRFGAISSADLHRLAAAPSALTCCRWTRPPVGPATLGGTRASRCLRIALQLQPLGTHLL